MNRTHKRVVAFWDLPERAKEQEYLPSPEEIREQCLIIQSTWSEEDRKHRAGILDKQFISVPKYRHNGHPIGHSLIEI